MRSGLAALGAGLLLAAAPAAFAVSPSDEERAARREIAAEIPRARLLWENDAALYHTRLGKWQPERITEAGVSEFRPRWSPDGSRIAFQRGDDRVFVMNADFTGAREVISGAHTHDWTGDGTGITAISSDGYRILRYDLASESVEVIYDAREDPRQGQTMSQSADLRVGGRYLLTFRREPHHSSFIVDLRQQDYLWNDEMARGDCKPTWSPDGSYFLMTARTSDRPILRVDFDAETGELSDPRVLINMDKLALRYYLHDAQVSNDGEWVVVGGKVLVGETMFGGREVYIWRSGNAPSDIVRLTFDGDDDNTPSLHVPAG